MNKFLKGALLAGGALCAVKGLDNSLEITHYTVTSERLPESFDGFRIAHLSDFHGESVPELYDTIKAAHPDLIACTGDMADDEGSYIPVVEFISRLPLIAPTYLITGNHDLWRSDFSAMEKEIEDSGAKFLHNERVELCSGGESIILTGISDPFTKASKNINRHIELALSQLPKSGKFDIALFHRANYLDRLKEHGFDLILSGHMHGGQIRIPHIGGVLAPLSSMASNGKMFFPQYTGGRYDYENTVMIVSRGLGNPMIIPRVFNRPELVIVQLKSA